MTAVCSSGEACVELFAGLGGMAIGLAAAGFEHRLLVERDPAAVVTLRSNVLTSRWRLHADDVRELDYATVSDEVGLLAAGVPCQPFSQGGAHVGPLDERNMFPETFAAIRALRPKAVLIENVRGLARPSFEMFLAYIVTHLRTPHIAIRLGESWDEHHRRLLVMQASSADLDERYAVQWRSIRVADYGVAQRRVRVLMVAIRRDLAEGWSWPSPTHGADELLRDKLDGYYWAEHGLSVPTMDLRRETERRARRLVRPTRLARWRTLRDVIGDLPAPAGGDEERCEPAGHRFWPGARLYRGHGGSHLDEVSKTIKAGVHGVAGGEHIVHLDDGSFRYLTVRECMRVQDLPDDLIVEAPRSGAMRQVGNAVPPLVAEVFGRAIGRAICEPRTVSRAEYVRQQDKAAGGYMRRQILIRGRRLTASVRLQNVYAYLYFQRSAGGNPIYLGRVGPGSREAMLARGWELAHRDHPELFIAPQWTEFSQAS